MYNVTTNNPVLSPARINDMRFNRYGWDLGGAYPSKGGWFEGLSSLIVSNNGNFSYVIYWNSDKTPINFAAVEAEITSATYPASDLFPSYGMQPL